MKDWLSRAASDGWCNAWRRPLTRGALVLLGGVSLMAVAGQAESWDPDRDPTGQAGAAAGDHSRLLERLIEQSQPLLSANALTQQERRLEGLKAPAALHAVAILVDFADSCFYGRQDEFPGPLPTSTQSSFYYAAHDSVYFDHLLQDVVDYYDSASGGRFQLQVTVHGRVVGLPDGMAHYGNHPEFGEQPVRLAADAIAALDQEIDFSLYDTVILIHAGAGQETDVLNDSPEQIYSTYVGPDAFQRAVEDSILTEPYIATDDHAEGDGVRHVLILPETQFQDPYEGFSGQFGSLGTYCFVVGLRLGMLSLSDFTPAGAPDSQGVGQLCLMGYGLFNAGGYIPPHPCAFNKLLMGWLDPYVVDPELAGTWTLHPSADSNHPQAAARIDLTGAEYYLLEYRLQDPDGNSIFSFAGDLNDNNVPDFFDASNPGGGGVPSRFFDPETDTRERLLGAEWDFFLTDNPARAPGVKGAGSGIYIWHIDEGVIRDVFGLRQNLFNADPRRKSVDLVEADGIQDLDSRQPSPFWLGGDDDSFRGEGNAAFGPDTRPATVTNGGVRSGLWVDEISSVVVDSIHVFHAGTDSAYTGILYAETMTFRCWRESDEQAAVRPLASRDLPGVDMTGSHLLVAPLDGDLTGGEPVFVATADSGRVYAWTADLAEWIDHDGDAGTFAPLAVGTDAFGEPVAWWPPAAAGRFDPTTAGLEIVLTSPAGLYAFHQDGTPVAGGPGQTDRGLVAAYEILLPPVLLSLDGESGLEAEVIACVVTAGSEDDPAGNRVRFLDHEGQEVAPAIALPGRATAPPVGSLDRELFITIETPEGEGALVRISAGETTVMNQVPLAFIPGSHPPLVADDGLSARSIGVDFAGPAIQARQDSPAPPAPGPAVVLVTSPSGRGQTIVIRSNGLQAQTPWPDDLIATSPLGPGGAYTGTDALGRLGAGGAVLTGWPRRPRPVVQASEAQPLGLGQGDSDRVLLFSTRDGRLFLTDALGEAYPGWPLAGPADLHATPAAVIQAAETSTERLVLMAAGTTPQITGLAADQDDATVSLQTAAVTRLRSWEWPDPAQDLQIPSPGAMYGGSPWRGRPVSSLTSGAVAGMALARSHVCYPQPLTTDVLRVRGQIPRQGRARAVILNLQGQRVRDSGEVAVLANTPFEVEIDMGGTASGLYLCRLEAGGQTSVRTIAVTR